MDLLYHKIEVGYLGVGGKEPSMKQELWAQLEEEKSDICTSDPGLTCEPELEKER